MEACRVECYNSCIDCAAVIPLYSEVLYIVIITNQMTVKLDNRDMDPIQTNFLNIMCIEVVHGSLKQ